VTFFGDAKTQAEPPAPQQQIGNLEAECVSSENVIGRGLKPLRLVAARPSVVELPYVDTTVDAARLEARATWSPQGDVWNEKGR